MESLPVEIFQEIFLSALSSEHFSERSLPAREYAANFQIAATCTRWRNIALQIPSLWAQIKVHGLCRDWIVQYVSIHLERSGTFPLELRFSLDKIDRAEPSDAEAYSRCLQLAGKHVSRWKRVHIELPQWMTADELIMLTMQSPLLEELVMLPVPKYAALIDYRSASMIHDHYTRAVNFHPEKSLRYFHDARQLVKLESHATPMVPKHPLERLTFLSISLRDIPDSQLWCTLAMTPNLQDLHLYYPRYGSSRSSFLPAADINLPHLSYLALYGLPGSFDWLNFFHAPKLYTLAVGIEKCPRIKPVFIKLRDTVRRLIITTVEAPDSGGFFNDTDAVALDLLTTIDTFEIRNLTRSMLQRWNGTFFEHLVHRVRRREGWPARLRRFVVSGCTFQFDACGSLFEFVRAKYEMAGEEEGFVCEVTGGTALVGATDKSNTIMDTVPQVFRGAVKIGPELSDSWSDDDESDDVPFIVQD